MKTPRKVKKKVKKTLELVNKGKVKIKLIDKETGISMYQYKITNKNK